MNQIERLIEAGIARQIIQTADRELSKLYKIRSTGEKLLLEKGIDPVIRANALMEMDTLVKHIAAVEDRRHQMRRLIEELDGQAAREATIRVISTNHKGAQIAITYYRDDGKKMSFTRHVHRDGPNWVGISTLTDRKVVYRQPGTAVVEAA